MLILDDIIAYKRLEVQQSLKKKPLQDLQAEFSNASIVRDFGLAIRTRLTDATPAVIAELKKASPTAGVLCQDFNPESIARSYADAGATCLSVLTDQKFFCGQHQYLQRARNASGLPCLRKDFIIHPYQIYESRMLCADCILLIVATLEIEEYVQLAELALELGMSVLAEVHTKTELEIALLVESVFIGINNRNLQDFTIKLQTSAELLPFIPEDKIVITESGIRTKSDVDFMLNLGIECFLVGEAFMSAPEPGEALAQMFNFEKPSPE